MELKEFDQLLQGNNFIRVSSKWIVFNDYETMNWETDEQKEHKSLQDVIDDIPEIGEIIAATDTFERTYDGGRGSSVSRGLSGQMGGGFNHAPDRGGKGSGERLANAELDFGTRKGNSFEAVLKRFEKKYADADIEYGVAIDDRGYVYEHMKGGSTSVAIHGNKGQMIIHNHPSGGNFSDSDLLSVSSSQERGIVATSSNAKTKSRYIFEKTSHFDSKGFVKALKRAQWPVEYSYSKGADWWLRRNAKKYGYKYRASGVPKN